MRRLVFAAAAAAAATAVHAQTEPEFGVLQTAAEAALGGWAVPNKHPEVHAQARLKFGKGTVMALAAVGMVGAVVIASLGLTSDWRPYVLLLGWLVVGLVYYAVRKRSIVASEARAG